MDKFKFSLIAAISKTNDVIGLDDTLPWKAPMDMKYFKKITTGNVVIMGRKTYESIGKALPNRINIVITSDQRNINDDFEGMIVNDLETALRIASTFKDKETIVIGGGQVYIEAMKTAHKLYITWVSRKDGLEITGNRFFADFNVKDFKLVDELLYTDDPKYNLEFNTFIRK